MKLKGFVWAIGLVLLFSAVSGFADTAIGTLAFEQIIGANDAPGVNGFVIQNYTGSFALPSSFPVTTPVTFTNVQLILNLTAGGSQTFNISSILPGPYVDSGTGVTPFVFADSLSFSSASISGDLSGITGSFFANLLPGSGNSLVAHQDLVILYANSSNTDPNVPAPVPEPSSVMLIGTGVCGFIARRRWLF